MLLCLVLALASQARLARSALSPLRALALLDTQDDDAQIAAVVAVDARTGALAQVGANFSWSTQAATSLDCATAFAPADARSGAPARWLSVVAVAGGAGVAAVAAASGAVLWTSPALAPPYVIASIAWDAATGALMAVAAAPSGRTDFVAVDQTTGKVTVVHAGLGGLPFPEPCQAALSLASGTLVTVGLDSSNDDADQTVDAYALASGAMLASLPWPSKTSGSVGRPMLVPAAAPGGNDTLVLIWSAPESASRPLRFLQLDLHSGAQRVLAEVPAAFPGLVVDIGGQPSSVQRAANGSFSFSAFGFDNPSDAQYLLQVGPVSASGGPAAVVMTALSGAGFAWSPALLPS
jgi:hypothetical protein